MMQDRGFTVWLTGLSGAGKSTLALLLARKLKERGVSRLEVLDGDEVRQHLSRGAGFSRQDRDAHVHRIAYVCHLLGRHGVSTLAAVISPYREARQFARRLVGDFVEVFVTAPIEVLEQRDPKGLYRRARAGELNQFTGISDPYEPPLHPDVVCHTDRETPAESVANILAALERRGHVGRPPAQLCSPEEEALVQSRLKSRGYL
jgi:adenylylsulfate kinase